MQRFNLDDTAVILIDHQVGTNAWAAQGAPPPQRDWSKTAGFRRQRPPDRLCPSVADRIKNRSRPPPRRRWNLPPLLPPKRDWNRYKTLRQEYAKGAAIAARARRRARAGRTKS